MSNSVKLKAKPGYYVVYIRGTGMTLALPKRFVTREAAERTASRHRGMQVVEVGDASR